MRDRMHELTAPQRARGQPPAAAAAGVASADQTRSFLDLAQSIQQAIREIQHNVSELRTLHRQAMHAVRESERSRLLAGMDALTQTTNKRTQSVRKHLQHITSQLQPGRTDYQMMRTRQLDLARKFRDAVVQYHDLQMEIQRSEKQQMERQLRIVNPMASDHEIHTMVESQSKEAVFSQRILESTRREEAKRLLTDVQGRHQHVLQLAKSIQELQQMFEDLSTMIEAQDAAVMKVADQVDDVEANTRQANVELMQAVKSARSARKKKWCLICFLILVLLAIALWLMFQYWLIPMMNAKAANAPASSPVPAPASATGGK